MVVSRIVAVANRAKITMKIALYASSLVASHTRIEIPIEYLSK